MESNPYRSPPETPREKRPVNLPRLILAASLMAALVLIFFDAPRWLVVVAGASSALAAEELIRKGFRSVSCQPRMLMRS
jgi:hypothetical protein